MPQPDHISDILLNKIRIERRFLLMPYYTWWFEYGRLEIIEPLTGSIPRARWSDWESFVHHASDDLLKTISDHDEFVEELRGGCARLQERLEVSDGLQSCYHRLVTPDLLGRLNMTESELFGARWPESVIPYLAQLIVNRTPPHCSPLYTIRPLWMRVGGEFLELRKHPPFVDMVEECDIAATKTLQTIDRLDAMLSRTRKAYHVT